jgi:hypothetical protein
MASQKRATPRPVGPGEFAVVTGNWDSAALLSLAGIGFRRPSPFRGLEIWVAELPEGE